MGSRILSLGFYYDREIASHVAITPRLKIMLVRELPRFRGRGKPESQDLVVRVKGHDLCRYGEIAGPCFCANHPPLYSRSSFDINR